MLLRRISKTSCIRAPPSVMARYSRTRSAQSRRDRRRHLELRISQILQLLVRRPSVLHASSRRPPASARTVRASRPTTEDASACRPEPRAKRLRSRLRRRRLALLQSGLHRRLGRRLCCRCLRLSLGPHPQVRPRPPPSLVYGPLSRMYEDLPPPTAWCCRWTEGSSSARPTRGGRSTGGGPAPSCPP